MVGSGEGTKVGLSDVVNVVFVGDKLGAKEYTVGGALTEVGEKDGLGLGEIVGEGVMLVGGFVGE